MNSKSTKRALLTSVLAMVVCLAMLVGSTFAWFTDTATTGVNKIQAGNLDIELSYKNNSTGGEFKKADKIHRCSMTTLCGSRVMWSMWC